MIYVSKSGKAFYFCSSKCEKNMLKLGRSVRKVRWTKAYREEKKARLKLLAHGTKDTGVKSGDVRKTEVEEKEEAREEIKGEGKGKEEGKEKEEKKEKEEGKKAEETKKESKKTSKKK